MNKLWVAILMVLVLFEGSAFAGSSRGASYQGYTSGLIQVSGSPVVVDTRGGLIYNMTLNATAAGAAVLTIYDANGTVENAMPAWEVPIYEVEVATALDSRSVDMNAAPLQTYTGIVATVTNGNAYLNVEK